MENKSRNDKMKLSPALQGLLKLQQKETAKQIRDYIRSLIDKKPETQRHIWWNEAIKAILVNFDKKYLGDGK